MKLEDLRIGDRVVVEYGSIIEHARVKDIADKVVLQLSDNNIAEFEPKHIAKVFSR